METTKRHEAPAAASSAATPSPGRRLHPWTPADVAALVDDRPADGVFRVHRDVFRDEQLFQLEMKHIFERTWVFLGLESDMPRPHDFITAQAGRQPVVVHRARDGRLHAFINSCRHRGAMVAHTERGNAKFHTCMYHGWVYDATGKNVFLKDHQQGGYTPAFDRDSHDLLPLPRFESYRGFLFGSLSADVPPLREHLGGVTAFIDLFVDQGEDGVEAVPGRVRFTFDANWKTQLENATDSYHFTDTHASYIGVMGRQQERGSAHGDGEVDGKAPGQAVHGGTAYGRIGTQQALARGVFDFGRGHSAFWGEVPDPQARPLYLEHDKLVARVGAVRARWMLYTRNMTVFPNLQLSENIAPQLRVLRPLSATRTEMLTFCIAPRGESKEGRRRRIRHYEEFFNPTGLATPDDIATYQDCQDGFAADAIDWQQAYARGMALLQTGPSPQAQELGFQPVSWLVGTLQLGDETCQQPAYREWKRLIVEGMARYSAAREVRA